MEKFSLTDIKKMNYSDVYHYIYKHKNSSKQAIANALQMSLPTVTQHLNSLIGQGLIEKCGQLKSQIGRKATAYSVIPNAKMTIGVEILKERVRITAVNLYGESVATVGITEIFENTEPYFSKICAALLDFIHTAHIEPSRILGAGFGLQGLISQDGREIIYGKVLDCTGLCIDAFQQHLPFPCRFIHDSECAALSDLWRNPDITDALYLSIGHHLGGALILERKVLSGRTGRSGTFEHMTLIPGGLLCYCGQAGCMECYCSLHALLEEDEDLDTFFQKKENDDPSALKRWDTFLQYLAMAINNLHMVIDSNIILGGHLAPYLTPADIARLHILVKEHIAFPEKEPFIKQGERHKHAAAIGAALPFITDYLKVNI